MREFLFDLAMILAAVVALHYRYLFTAATLPAHDVSDALLRNLEMYRYAAEQIAAGVVPLWTPYELGGYPFLALGLPGVFYAPNFIYAYETVERAIQYDIAIHVYLTAAFAYLLGRDVLKYRISALCLALLVVFTVPMTYFIADADLTSLHTIAYMPLVLLCLRRVLNSGRVFWSMLLALCLAVQIYAGSVQFLLFEGMAFTVYALLEVLRRYLADWEPLRAVAPKAGLLLLGVFIGLLLAGPQLLPTAELLASESVRSVAGAPEAPAAVPASETPLAKSLQWDDMLPGSEGGPLPITGPFVIAFAIFALFTARTREKWVLAITCVLTLVLAMPLFALVYDWVYQSPIFDAAAAVNHAGMVFALFFFLLAALGTDGLLESLSGDGPRRRTLAPLYLTLLALMAWPLVQGFEPHHLPFLAAAYLFLLLLAASSLKEGRLPLAAFGIVGCVLFEAARSQAALPLPSTDETPDFAANAEFLQIAEEHTGRERMLLLTHGRDPQYRQDPRLGALSQERTLSLYADPAPDDFGRAWNGILDDRELTWTLEDASGNSETLDWVQPSLLPYLDMLNVTYVVGLKPGSAFLNAATKGTGLYEKYELEHHVIYLNKNAMPIAYVLHDARTSGSVEQMYADMNDPTINLRTTAILAQDIDTAAFAVATGPEGIIVDRYEANEVELALQVTSPGILVFTDTYFPGWKATLNDRREEEVLRVNGFLRGVTVQPGDTKVVFSYEPRSFGHGLRLGIIGAVAWTLVLMALATYRIIGKQNRSPDISTPSL